MFRFIVRFDHNVPMDIVRVTHRPIVPHLFAAAADLNGEHGRSVKGRGFGEATWLTLWWPGTFVLSCGFPRISDLRPPKKDEEWVKKGENHKGKCGRLGPRSLALARKTAGGGKKMKIVSLVGDQDGSGHPDLDGVHPRFRGQELTHRMLHCLVDLNWAPR